MHDIIAIGSITKDNFFVVDYETIDWPKTSLKKAIVLPLGEKVDVKSILATLGGNSSNASVTFSRQGFRTACFGKVGRDITAKEIFAWLKKDKVTPIFAYAKDVPTAYSVLLLRNGERTILGYHGASDTLVEKDIPWSKLKSKWWYLSLAGKSDKFLKPLLEFAKKNKIQVAFNPSGYHIMHRRQEIIEALPYLTFLVLNSGEAAALTGISFTDPRAVFKKIDELMPGIVAVTDGESGVTVSDGKTLYKAGIFKEKRLLDRTGAGDAFGSGFVAGLMHRQKISKTKEFTAEDICFAIRLATANATGVVEEIGATEGIITKKQFEIATEYQSLTITTQAL
ncbi:MAG TPA: carbohydrate kinase family protein [Candidatus Paceibacterota bacterium]